MTGKCKICGATFDNGIHYDCGGDCAYCMGTIAGDTDVALTLLPILKQQRDELLAASELALEALNDADGLTVAEDGDFATTDYSSAIVRLAAVITKVKGKTT